MRAALLALPLLFACSEPADSGSQASTSADPASAAAAAASAGPAQPITAGGSPCPTISAQAAAGRVATLGSSAGLNGVTFSRQGGSSSCKIDDGGDIVCDMRAPGLVRVTAANNAGETYFDIPAGRDARVSMSHDIARCVLN
jgi:hypothetical protein